MPVSEFTIKALFEAEDRLSPKLERVEKRITNFGEHVEKQGSRIQRTFNEIGLAFQMALGIGIYEGVSKSIQLLDESVKKFANFEKQATTLAALTATQGEDLQRLAARYRELASTISRELGVAPQHALSSLEALVKAGLSGAEAVEALKAALMLAKIEGVDFASAGNSLVQVMAQFGLRAEESARALDVLINASRLGIGTAYDFAQGLANAGASAKMIGLSIEDAVTWLVILERRFGSALEAGTHLNRFLLDLREIAEKLGVPIREASGQLRDMNDVILDVISRAREVGSDFTKLQDALRGIDMRAIKALATFTQMTESFIELRREVGEAGTAVKTFSEIMDTTAGRLDVMNARLEEAKMKIGKLLAPVVIQLSEGIIGLADSVEILSKSLSGVSINSREAWDALSNIRNLPHLQQPFLQTAVMIGETLVDGLTQYGEAIELADKKLERLSQDQLRYSEAIRETNTATTQFSIEQIQATQELMHFGTTIDDVKRRLDNLTETLKTYTEEINLLKTAISLGDSYYNTLLAIEHALGRNVELTEEAKASQERLAATQQLLGFMMQNFGLVQQAMQMYMLGGKEAGDLLLNTFRALTQAMQDGIVTQQEFQQILQQLGVDSQNVAGSLQNIMATAFETVRKAIEGNILAVDKLLERLNELNGKVVTYIVRQITESSSEKKGRDIVEDSDVDQIQVAWELMEGSAQHGAWFTREGLYYLHRGEMVLPREVAEWFRRGGVNASRVVNVSVSVNVSGVSGETDWDRVAEIISRRINRNLVGM